MYSYDLLLRYNKLNFKLQKINKKLYFYNLFFIAYTSYILRYNKIVNNYRFAFTEIFGEFLQKSEFVFSSDPFNETFLANLTKHILGRLSGI